MGYRNWRLGRGPSYQVTIARWRAAKLLEAHANDYSSPHALGYEQPFTGWDDIVEFGSTGGQFTATHYQVKRQYTDFSAKDLETVFEALFREAAKILQGSEPYGEVKVPVANRRFHFVVPSDGISAGNLDLDQLKALLEKCPDVAEADTILRNQGAEIDDGKGNGDQQRAWLNRVKSAVADDSMRARLLAQLTVEFASESSLLHETSQTLERCFERPAAAEAILTTCIQDVGPEGLLDADRLLEMLEEAQPRTELRSIHLAKHGSGYAVRPLTRIVEVDALADRIVTDVWARQGAPELLLGFEPPNDNESRALRNACVRLILHARRSPVRLAGRDAWWCRCRADVLSTLGIATADGSILGEHYVEREIASRVRPRTIWTAQQLAYALQRAMDEHLWKQVQAEAERLLAEADAVAAEQTVISFRETPDFYQRILRGWWMPDARASGTARAGPLLSGHVAEVVASWAVIEATGFLTGPSCEPASIGTLGRVPVRALAVECAGGLLDGLPAGVRITRFAREITAPPCVVIVRGDIDSYYMLAKMRPLDQVDGSSGMQTGTPAALLMDPTALIAAGSLGKDAAEARIQRWCDILKRDHEVALDAAIRQHEESDAAK